MSERNPAREIAPDARAAVGRALAGRGWPEGTIPPRSELLPLLQAVQSDLGWLSQDALYALADRMGLPFPDVWGVASFYAMLRLEPPAAVRVQVCDDVACRLRGCGGVLSSLESRYGPARRFGGHAYPRPDAERRGQVDLEAVPCLGRCDHAPVAVVGDQIIQEATFEKVEAGVGGNAPPEPRPTHVNGTGRVLAHRTELARAQDLGAPAILDMVEKSGLVGRGGAAFPAAFKWRAVAKAPGMRRVVCNADESEPGTFKDRVLMEEYPETVIDGLRIAMFAVGAVEAWIYIRGEYEKAAERLQSVIKDSRIRIFRGAGAYVCGEETALFNSVEGRRGEPRNKPPFPTENGLFGGPTLINNVETLANLPLLVREGPEAFRAFGTQRSTGTKLFSLSGHVEKPGLYEVPFGTKLGDLLRLAGGVWKGRRLQAVLCGGAAGTFLGPDALDTPLSFEGLRGLGSGAIVVLDEGAALWEIVERIARFFRDESCGQCVPCRVGTQRQLELVQRMAPGDDAILRDLTGAMTDASICGLGQTAGNAVISALDLRSAG